jgi:NDP-sugar pyrophosphorylase family protein
MYIKNLILAGGGAKPELSILIPPGKNKVLLRILGKPIIYYPLTSIQRVNRVETILVYRLGEEEVYREASKHSIEQLVPIQQVSGNSIHEAILSAESKLRDTDYFFLLIGDIVLSHEALDMLINTHLSLEPDATVLIVPYDPEYAETYGLLYLHLALICKVLIQISSKLAKHLLYLFDIL